MLYASSVTTPGPGMHLIYWLTGGCWSPGASLHHMGGRGVGLKDDPISRWFIAKNMPMSWWVLHCSDCHRTQYHFNKGNMKIQKYLFITQPISPKYSLKILHSLPKSMKYGVSSLSPWSDHTLALWHCCVVYNILVYLYKEVPLNVEGHSLAAEQIPVMSKLLNSWNLRAISI